jgi:hypothetical protein
MKIALVIIAFLIFASAGFADTNIAVTMHKLVPAAGGADFAVHASAGLPQQQLGRLNLPAFAASTNLPAFAASANLPQANYKQMSFSLNTQYNFPQPQFTDMHYGMNVQVAGNAMQPQLENADVAIAVQANMQGPPAHQGELPGIIFATSFNPQYGPGMRLSLSMPTRYLPQAPMQGLPLGFSVRTVNLDRDFNCQVVQDQAYAG